MFQKSSLDRIENDGLPHQEGVMHGPHMPTWEPIDLNFEGLEKLQLDLRYDQLDAHRAEVHHALGKGAITQGSHDILNAEMIQTRDDLLIEESNFFREYEESLTSKIKKVA